MRKAISGSVSGSGSPRVMLPMTGLCVNYLRRSTRSFEDVQEDMLAQVRAALLGEERPPEPTLNQRMTALRDQIYEMCEEKGEWAAMPQARSQAMHYMKGLHGAAALRRYCCTLTHLEDLDELIAAVFEEQRKAGLDPDDVREVPFP